MSMLVRLLIMFQKHLQEILVLEIIDWILKVQHDGKMLSYRWNLLLKKRGYYRRGTRLVYDDVDTAIRYQLGDVTPGVTGFQTSPGLLGLSVEKSYQKIKPSQTIQPTGKRSFRLARPSVVQLLNNGKVSRRFRLDPGEYDLDDLPLSAGANNIVLRIEDDLGAKRDINFTVYSDNALLEPGLSLWHFGVGLKSSFGEQSDPKKISIF